MIGTLTVLWKEQRKKQQEIKGFPSNKVTRLEKELLETGIGEAGTDEWKALKFLQDFAGVPSSDGVTIYLLCDDI